MAGEIADPGLVMDYQRSLLVTDLYQLNMVEAGLASGLTETATFEFFVRKLPPSRGFLMAAGLDAAIRFVTQARASDEELDWLRKTGRFSDRLLDFLADFRFSGDIDAIPEGTIVFPDEPLLRVTAPMPQAQLLETRLINLLHFETLIASKAARMVLAAGGAPLVDFGLRRAHAAEAGTLAARAAWIAGFAGTASVPAGLRHGIPLVGTMAHSWVQAHEDETHAFLDFARARPDQTVFLIDTYDVDRAARTVARLAPELEREGIGVRGVRLDSGDLGAQARAVRRVLDEAGLTEARIVASGGLDEHGVAALVAEGAPIDTFGIGTSLVTSEDLPALDCAYKLKAYAGRATRKLSVGKSYWPGPVQVHRRHDADGHIAADRLTTADAPPPGAGWTPLLRPVLRDGQSVEPMPDLDAIRRHAAAELKSLPEPLRRLDDARRFGPEVADDLRALADAVDRALQDQIAS